MRLVCGVGPLILVQVYYWKSGTDSPCYTWGCGVIQGPPPIPHPRFSLSPQMMRFGSSGGPEIGREGQVNTPTF